MKTVVEVKSELTDSGIKHMFYDMPMTDKQKFDRLLHILFIEQAKSVERFEDHVHFVNFLPRDRYYFDYNMDMTRWMQVDTSQDASYYGVWINPSLHCDLSYVEGDIYLNVYDSIKSFQKAVKTMKQWNENNGYGFTIDPGLKPCKVNQEFLENFKKDITLTEESE